MYTSLHTDMYIRTPNHAYSSIIDQSIFNGESPNPQTFGVLEYGPAKGRERYYISDSNTTIPPFEKTNPQDASAGMCL